MADSPAVSGISELVLEVEDLDRARAFYRDLLGFEETLYGEGHEGRYVVEFWTQDMGEYARGARAGGPPGTFRAE